MGKETRNSDFFVAGDVLPADSPSYIERPADDELYEAVLTGQLCYVFATYHMGTSSLMTRTAWRLQQQGVRISTIDLSGFGTNASIEQFYSVLIKRMKFQIELSTDPDTWWTEQSSLDATQRFISFLHEVVLAEVEEPIVIFVDGINYSSKNLSFMKDFLATIQFLYDERTTDSIYTRLTFVLLGKITITDLANNGRLPLTVDKEIYLREFSREIIQDYQLGLAPSHPDQAEVVLDRIYYWTNGHPYLTQKLSSQVAKMWDGHWNESRVDGLVERLFPSSAVHNDPNLQLIQDSINTSPQRQALIKLYRQIRKGNKISAHERSRSQRQLELCGLVRTENGTLKIRNQVYRQAFDQDWIKRSTPINWKLNIALILVVVAILLAGFTGFSVVRHEQKASQAQALIDDFWSSNDSADRLNSLAALFNLGGYDEEARRLFYEELSTADQVALFDLADPRAVGEQLIVVVEGLYEDSRLENNEPNNALLRAMAQPLAKLENASSSLGAIGLELEITQWLKGREYYLTEEQYQRAIDAYNVAITMNDSNSGVYFDRGMAFTALGNENRALVDFETVLSLDQSWETQIQQALNNDTQLYMALWGEGAKHKTLVALVPTPTNTPTSTATPTPSPTPTSTSTPVPPTSTSTPEPTATLAPTDTPTPRVPDFTPTFAPSPTPSLSTGTFTLLSPLSVNDPTYGPTTFEWQWTGPLPPSYGFEVRVWREGELPLGAHNAVLDNQNGHVKQIGNNSYQLDTDINDAAGVQGHSGIYLWTVALVKISPEYADLGQQAEPVPFRFAAPGNRSSGDSDGGGGVGIK